MRPRQAVLEIPVHRIDREDALRLFPSGPESVARIPEPREIPTTVRDLVRRNTRRS